MHMQMVMLFLMATAIRLGTMNITISLLIAVGMVRRMMLLMVLLVLYIGFV
jgi:hypothetical protein